MCTHPNTQKSFLLGEHLFWMRWLSEKIKRGTKEEWRIGKACASKRSTKLSFEFPGGVWRTKLTLQLQYGKLTRIHRVQSRPSRRVADSLQMSPALVQHTSSRPNYRQ